MAYPVYTGGIERTPMNPQKYFFFKARGINHDLARHKREEEELLAHLAKEESSGKTVSEHQFPNNLLKIVREGKAAAAAKIGLPKSKPRRK